MDDLKKPLNEWLLEPMQTPAGMIKATDISDGVALFSRVWNGLTINQEHPNGEISDDFHLAISEIRQKAKKVLFNG